MEDGSGIFSIFPLAIGILTIVGMWGTFVKADRPG